MRKTVLALAVLAGFTAGCAAPDSQAPRSSEPPKVIQVTVKGGKSTQEQADVRLSPGQHVVLQVNSDVADEVHVHGYDKSADVAPGKPVTIEFDATIPGRFEAELEDHHQKILQFQVGS